VRGDAAAQASGASRSGGAAAKAAGVSLPRPRKSLIPGEPVQRTPVIDKLAGSFMAFVRLAFIQRHLRLLDPSDKA